MNPNTIVKILNFLLVITAFIMIYLGYKGGMLPPTFTGIGFLVIAGILYLQGKSSKN